MFSLETVISIVSLITGVLAIIGYNSKKFNKINTDSDQKFGNVSSKIEALRKETKEDFNGLENKFNENINQSEERLQNQIDQVRGYNQTDLININETLKKILAKLEP